MAGENNDGVSKAAPADLQEFVDETEKFSPVFKTTMEELADDWRAAAAGNDHVTFPAPFDEAEDVRKAWGARSDFVESVRQAFIDADSYDPDSPGEVLTVPTSTIDAVLDRTADKLIEKGIDPDDAEAIASGTPELFDAVVDGHISVEAAVEVAGLPSGEQRNVLSTGLDSNEIMEVLDGDHGKNAKTALTEGHGYRVRLLMLDPETRSSVHMSDTIPIILEDGEDHLSFDEIQKRVSERRAAIVEQFQANGLSYDEAQAAYEDVEASVEFLDGDTDARMALDGGADEDSKPGDPDADNRYGVADAQARAIQLLEENETPNGQRLWQRAMQAQMGTPTIFVLETDEGARDAQALIEEHTSEPGGNHYQPRPGGVDTDDIAAEIQAIRRYDPQAAAALEIAVARELDGEDRAEFIEQMATQTRLEATTNAVLSQGIDGDVEIDQNEVDAEVERILDETTGTRSGGVYGQGAGERYFNASEAEYQINELAKTNPALAVIVKQQLDAQLQPDEVAEFNRLIADSGFVDDINSVGNHPLQGAEGAAKGFVNGFIFMGNALIPDADREFGDFGVGEKIPYFELENSAQRGGANMGAIAELALAGKGVIKIGGKWFIRNGDNVTEIAIKNGDTLPAPSGPRVLLPDGTVKPPPPGARPVASSPEVQAYADVINGNRKNWKWKDIAPNARTSTQRAKIRATARSEGLIPTVPMKPTGYPDFAAVNAVHKVDNLPRNLWEAGDPEQFAWLNARLPGGKQPPGTVWHHSELSGRMELVEFGVHKSVGHTGGRKIWGGGSGNR